MITNFSNETLTVPKATVLGIAEEISESIVDKIKEKASLVLTSPMSPTAVRRTRCFFINC